MAAKIATGTFRRFEITEGPDAFLMTEIEPVETDPRYSSGYGWKFFSPEAAWVKARTQAKPVFVETLAGGMQELGIVFDPAIYERSCYAGYVSYGISMSDGYYAPIKLDNWVSGLRSSAKRDAEASTALYGMDIDEAVRAAWDAYKAAVQANPNI